MKNYRKLKSYQTHVPVSTRFDRENGTVPTAEIPTRSAIKFATKAVMTPYLYVKSSKSYEYERKKKKIYDEWLEENLMKKEKLSVCS